MQFEETILGERWTIIIAPTGTDWRLADCDGFCDKSIRKILVDDMTTCDKYELDDRTAYVAQNLRHEIIHAFMDESGLQQNWEHKKIGQEETVVDWIAAQYPKLRAVIEDAEGRYMSSQFPQIREKMEKEAETGLIRKRLSDWRAMMHEGAAADGGQVPPNE